jgi:hypothetical protein
MYQVRISFYQQRITLRRDCRLFYLLTLFYETVCGLRHMIELLTLYVSEMLAIFLGSITRLFI